MENLNNIPMGSDELLVIQIEQKHSRKTLQDVSTEIWNRNLWLYRSKGAECSLGTKLGK